MGTVETDESVCELINPIFSFLSNCSTYRSDQKSQPTHQPWTPSGRRCSLSNLRQISFWLPLPDSRLRPKRPMPRMTNMSVISVTWERRSKDEVEFDETNDKLTKALAALEEKEKAFKNAEEEVSALSRRIMLMEEEAKKADSTLAE